MPYPPLRVLVVGCGNMGTSHATAYHTLKGFALVGLVSTGPSKHALNAQLGGGYPVFDDYAAALRQTRPDAVCIATYPDTHEAFALQALAAGCHVFLEKPLAATLAGAGRVVAAAGQAGRQVLVGYILRVHPAWVRFVAEARQLGKPLVMRLNLNQQSAGPAWATHQKLLQALSPIVDCGVHYLDVMCQMTQARPTWVSAIGARLSAAIPAGQYNYGQLQIRFADGSVGWYEAGWGPMMSETAFFVKDVVGPRGSVSIVAGPAGAAGSSATVAAHTQTEGLRIHHAELTAAGAFARPDTWLALPDEPDHQELCNREQQYFLRAIREELDLRAHLADAVNSLRIALACDESVRTGEPVRL